MQLEFGSGTVHARQDKDNVRAGGDSSPLLVEGMPFWQVMDHNLDFWNTQAGGQFAAIVGLGHPDRVPPDLAGPMRDTLLGRLGVSRFAFCLPQRPGAAGWLTFGPLETQDSLFSRVSVVGGSYYWIPELKGERIGDGEVLGSCEPRCAALIDSGSSVLLVPPAVMSALQDALGTHSGVSCTQISQFPNLVFELGGVPIVLPPTAYMVEDSWSWCVPAVKAVARTSPWGPVWSLGLPFLRQYYTVFDREGPSLHIAEAAKVDCAGSVGGSTLAARGGHLGPRAAGGAPSLALRGAPPAPAKLMGGDLRWARMPTWLRRSIAPLARQ
jgi:hypothetical protein